jgi:hypothetical protein
MVLDRCVWVPLVSISDVDISRLLLVLLILDLVLSASFFFFFATLDFELRASPLSHSTSPIFVMGFF